MDALQVISSATEIVSTMVVAIGALDQASRDFDDAPTRIRSLEEFIYELQTLSIRIKQKHTYKLDNPQLDLQIQGLNGLIDRLHPNLIKAKRVVTRSKAKNFAKIIWNSMIGDPLGKILNSMKRDLNWWLESQTITERIENVIEATASNIPIRLKVNLDQGYPVSRKCSYVRTLLSQNSSRRVILIVGLSGIGKSCLARQVASDLPPKKFDGAVELGFGQYCSRAACGGDKKEYQRRLARKLGKFLVQIGFWKRINDENCRDLEYVSFLLQKALYGKRIVILLDDVWEQDIVERFAKVYDNDCRYLVTTRNESVYEITEADKVELGKDDIREIGKNVLLYHSHLTEDELPDVAATLLERCGHHPLTVAVMGKALRKETRPQKWEKAIANLSMYATCAPGPISYVNEKEAENTVTIFGSLEFSLEAMPDDPKKLFTALAVLSWAEPIPETCLEAVWSVLGPEILFSLTVCKLIEGSLLMKDDHDSSYQIHDMVSLYLDSKTSDSVGSLLIDSSEESAFVSPWLFVFGKESVKRASEEKIEMSLGLLEEKHAAITLEAIAHALEVGISSSEFETSRVGFCRILGSKITRLLSSGSEDLVSVSAIAITNVFTKNDYSEYMPFLENTNAVDKLACLLETCDDPLVETSVFALLANLAEFGSRNTTDEILSRIPMNRLTELLSPHSDEWHESVFSTLMSLTKAGKSKAVEKMFASEIDKSLIKLLETGSDVAQNNAIVILKTLYELGGPVNASIRPGTLKLLPWQARLRLEKFVHSDVNCSLPSPKPQTFEDLVRKLLSLDGKMLLEAMQDLIPIIEKGEEPKIRDMILRGPLVKRLSELLQYNQSTMQKEVRSESAFLLMKLACSGGQACVKKFLEYDVVSELVKMMQCGVAEVQDSAYSALHNILFADGGALAVVQIVEGGLLERLIHSMDSKLHKTREVGLLCVLDIVEMGNKACLERMLSSQVVEKIVKIEKLSGGTGEHVVGLLKGISKCKSLTASAERKSMKQRVVKKVRMAVKGHKVETQVLAAVEGYMSEGSKGASSSCNRKRK